MELITFMLIAYNQEAYIERAIDGAMSQTYSPLEIIISDDHSKDNTFEIIKRKMNSYKGSHKIVINRNEKNLGLSNHINKLIKLSKGNFIVLAGGDDISKNERTEVLYNIYKNSNKKYKSLFSNVIVIDEHGNENGEYIRTETYPNDLSIGSLIQNETGIIGSSHAFSRDIFERFGPLPIKLIREDMVLPIRSSLLGEIYYYNKPLVYYRRHMKNKWQPNPNFESVGNLIFWRKERLDDYIKIYKSWLNDIKLARNPYDKQYLKLIEILTKRLKNTENEERYYADSGLSLNLLKNYIVNGGNAKIFLRMLSVKFIPGIYLNYINKKLRMRSIHNIY